MVNVSIVFSVAQKYNRIFITAAVGIGLVLALSILPFITIDPIYDGAFPLFIGSVFVASVVVGGTAPMRYTVVAIILCAILLPITKITASASINLISTGLLFGTVTQLRPSLINLRRRHFYLIGLVLFTGAYYNLVPLLTGDDSTFNAKLWLYNLGTFAKYAALILIVAQARLATDKVLRVISLFAVGYAGFVILDAFHVSPINLWMKSFTHFSQVFVPGAIEHRAFNYFRSSGLAIDAIQAGTKLALLLAVALSRGPRVKLNNIVIPALLLAIALTGSRSATILAATAFGLWFVYNRQWGAMRFSIVNYVVVLMAFVLVFMANESFRTVLDISVDRHIKVIRDRTFHTDESFLYRANEITTSEITLFGNGSDRLVGVHSETARTLRFYGVAGIAVLALFWISYWWLGRRSYVWVALVSMLALSTTYLWPFHIEGLFMPVVFVTALPISFGHSNPKSDS